MSKVVYLLGAGASYGKREKGQFLTPHGVQETSCTFITEGIPIVNEIKSELKIIIEDLKNLYPEYQEDGNKIGALVKDMAWLKKESERHMTIDTFAKKLYLQDNRIEFERLKKTLSSFFIIVQLKYPTDKRYDAFLANVLTLPQKQIPNDITVLTWNYDSQFEIAYREFNSTFNRQIDRAIFEQLLSLKTVYIQDPNPERIAQNLVPVLSDLHNNTNVKIVQLKDVDQFYLPSEL